MVSIAAIFLRFLLWHICKKNLKTFVQQLAMIVLKNTVPYLLREGAELLNSTVLFDYFRASLFTT